MKKKSNFLFSASYSSNFAQYQNSQKPKKKRKRKEREHERVHEP
jgi:hypothetical protein